ncbi:MAG: molybdopterin-dependent oxidoreductase alpha subunit [Crocinitomicaceae bacterium]|jgi:molybdopterin-dependent oxidoreductase alpha subunit
MSKPIDKPSVYPHPAGGWGALKSSVKHIIRSENAAEGIKTLLKANQSHGFDCPGCAWGEESSAGKIDFCENGVKAVAWEVTSRRADRRFFAKNTIDELSSWDDHHLEKSGRLTEPMYYDGLSANYRPVSWDDAFDTIAKHLNSLSSPNQALFYTSGRTSNEAAYLYQLFGRAFGTNNFPDCSNMCHEASGIGLTESIGTGKGTVTMEDFDKADAIFVFGQNPGTNHPRMLATLRKASKRGAHIVAINNLKERGLQRFSDPQSPKEMLIGSSTTISQHYITPRLGGDMALVRGIAKSLFERSVEQPSIIDHDFINQHCTNFSDYQAQVEKTSWEKIIEQSGVDREEIEQLTDIYANSHATIFTWAMGITQHRHSVATVQELVNVLLLRGNIGKAGAGACPVRGHSNVQGNRTVGINELPSAEFLDALEKNYSFSVPKNPGLNTVDSIHAMLKHEAKVFIAMGGNFAAAAPDTQLTYQALAQCELTVHISTKLNRSHVTPGKYALIIPCLGRTEIDAQLTGDQFITVEDSMSMVHSSQGAKPPASPELLSETAIVAGIAQATLGSKDVNWPDLAADYGLIRDEMSKVLVGFDNFNERIKQKGGFYLQNSASLKNWQTKSKRAVFTSKPLPDALIHEQQRKDKNDKAKDMRLTLQTLRSHDQYNTTIYGMDDRYRGVIGERKVLFMNPEDIKLQGFKDGDWVDITTAARYLDDHSQAEFTAEHKRQVMGFKIVSYQIPMGCVAAYYPETNPLVPLNSVADNCGTPTYKSIPINIRASI